MLFKFALFYLFATCALSALAEPLVIRLITSIAKQSKAVEQDIEGYKGLGNPVFIASAVSQFQTTFISTPRHIHHAYLINIINCVKRTDFSMLIANITEVAAIALVSFPLEISHSEVSNRLIGRIRRRMLS